MDTNFIETTHWLEVPVDFWEFSLRDNSDYTVENLHLDLENTIKEVGDKRNRTTNVKSTVMTDWLMTDHKPFKYLCDHVEELIQQWHIENTDLELKTFMTTCWGSIYKRGDYSELHAHHPALYSWVYYVKVDEDSAPLHFPNNPGIYYKPTAGTGIIFPGWLKHQVQTHESDEERILVVGNVEGTGAVNYPQRSFTNVTG
jgi:hypothetical protein|tara:strand:- start:1450 stop:2049 length:600 start_codon:yes stop_codon:yes gene_type:complete